MSAGQHRSWCLTLNNYTVEEENSWKTAFSLANGGIKWFIFQRERGVGRHPRRAVIAGEQRRLGDANQQDQADERVVEEEEEEDRRIERFGDAEGRQAGGVGSEGTPHLQGFVQFATARTLGGVKRIFGRRVHAESAWGNAKQASDYCCKEDTRDTTAGVDQAGPFTYGTDPRGERAGQGSRHDLEEVAQLIRGSLPVISIFERLPVPTIKYYRSISSIAMLYSRRRSQPPSVFWLYGPTGSGKSRFAYAKSIEPGPDGEVEQPYYKNDSKWWDGYHQEKTVVIEDFRRDFFSWSFLLRLLDRYPMVVEMKGSSIHFDSSTIFITCPVKPTDLFAGIDEDINQLVRRINHVIEFPQLGNQV